MELEELKEEIFYLFNPEPDDDGSMPEIFPHQMLEKKHKLDFSYMHNQVLERSNIHSFSRLCPTNEKNVRILFRNSDVPSKLIESGLQIFADSIIAYHKKEKRQGQIKYYPSIILTCWSGFETFVRYASELMISTVRNVPTEVINFLQEKESLIDNKGLIKYKTQNQSVLDRYFVFLKYGYNLQIDRGNKYWQNLEKSKNLRNYYTHLDVKEPKTICTDEVINFLESVLLAIIWPSSLVQRTIMLDIFWLHGILAELSKLSNNYIEKPFFHDWISQGEYYFYCSFDNVDITRFPKHHTYD